MPRNYKANDNKETVNGDTEHEDPPKKKKNND